MTKNAESKLHELSTTNSDFSPQSTVSENKIQNKLLEQDASNLKLIDLFEGAKALNKDANEITSFVHISDEIKFRIQAVAFIEASFSITKFKLVWRDDLYSKQLLELAVACDRIATTEENLNDKQAVYYWTLGVQFIEKFCTHFPDQPQWVIDLYSTQLLKGAVACDRIATKATPQSTSCILRE